MRRSSGETPLLVVASLAAVAADGVDAATLSFLTAQALEDRRKEEEERKMKEQEAQEMKLKELEARQRAVVRELDALLLLPFERRSDQEEDRVVKLQKLRERLSRERSAILLAPSKRKKKKKRKKKLPKSSSFLRLSRCSSRCVPSCCRLQACDARHHGRFGPEVQLRRHWWHAWLVLLVTLHLALCFLPCLLARDARHHGRYGPEGMLRFAVQKIADFRSRSSSQVVDFLSWCRGRSPWSCCCRP